MTIKQTTLTTAAAGLAVVGALYVTMPEPPKHFAPRLEFEIESNDVGRVIVQIESSTNLRNWNIEYQYVAMQRSNSWIDSNAFAPAKFYRVGVSWTD